MKVVKSSIILLFTINSTYANGNIGLLQNDPLLPDGAVLIGNGMVMGTGAGVGIDNISMGLVEQVSDYAKKSVDIEQSLRRKRLQFFENPDKFSNRVAPIRYDANFITSGFMSPILLDGDSQMSDFDPEGDAISLVGEDTNKQPSATLNFKIGNYVSTSYLYSSPRASLFNSGWSTPVSEGWGSSSYDFYQSYKPCPGNKALTDGLGDSAQFLESFMYKLDTRFMGCSDEYLTVVDDGYNLKPMIDTKKFCKCASEISHEDNVEEQIENKDVLDDFADKLYGKLLAHRMKNFAEFLERSKGRFDEFEKGKDSVDSYSCSSKNVEALSKKLKGCFGGSAASAIDKALELDGTKDSRGFFSSLIPLGESGKLGRSKDRMAQLFSKVNEKTISKPAYEKGEDQKVKEFAEIFILQYEKHSKDILGFPRSYVDELNAYIQSDPVMLGAYLDFKKNELEVMDSILKAKASDENRRAINSYVRLDQQYLSQVQEDMLQLQFATSIFSKTLPRLIDGSSKATIAQISKAFNDLEMGNEEGVKAMGDIYSVMKEQHEQELRLSCRDQIMFLEESCNEDNAQEVMSSVSTEEFIAINDSVDGVNSEDVSINAKKYCVAMNKGLFKDSERTVLSVEVASQSVVDEIRSVYDPSSDIASKRKSNDENNVANGALGGFTERANTAGQIISNGQQDASGVAGDGSSSEYNFDEAAQFLESYNSSNSSLPSNSFASSNVIDNNSLQSMIQNPSTSVKSLEDVKTRVEDEAEAIAKELEENRNSTAVSTDEASQSAELRAELAALKAQIAELNTAITAKSEKPIDEDDPEREKRIAAQRNKVMSNIAASSGFGGGRRDAAPAGNTRAVQQASSGSSIPSNLSAGAGGSSSSAGTGISAINRLGATGGLGLTAGSSSRASSGAVAGDNIAKSDQRLVAKAIAEGNNSVVLADGRVYYIGHDEDGNVILSETAEEVLAGVTSPEQEGPQLPTPKAEDGPKREIASEGEEVKVPGEDSIYTKFLNAAEINE
ncbi:hypothetical protein ABMA70_03545 [Halobacteriovorax sp. XZX-3]|uniref:hypothetical protein n=1 Tax=unclassified Halobacteriovorax TaxID=2639665 RepID=UPI00371A397C